MVWADDVFVEANGNGYTVSGTTYAGFTTNRLTGYLMADPSAGLRGYGEQLVELDLR